MTQICAREIGRRGESMIGPSGASVRVGCVAIALLCGIPGDDLGAQAMEAESQQWLLASTKVSYAVDKWRVYGDAQFRLKADWRELDQYLLEVAAPYSPNKNWELQPDLRITVKPALIEYRAGAGVTLKALASEWQFAAQHKYQLDLESTGATKHGLRQIFFVNKRVGDRVILSTLAPMPSTPCTASTRHTSSAAKTWGPVGSPMDSRSSA
jgi:hypothetical protein